MLILPWHKKYFACRCSGVPAPTHTHTGPRGPSHGQGLASLFWFLVSSNFSFQFAFGSFGLQAHLFHSEFSNICFEVSALFLFYIFWVKLFRLEH